MASLAPRHLVCTMIGFFAAVVLWPGLEADARVNSQRRTNPAEVKASPDSEKSFRLSPRFDRFFPLAESFGYAGTGRFEDIYYNSRDEGDLDFAAGSDHAEYFSDNEWLWMQDISNRFNEEGRFVTLNGYERAGDQGHWNFYTSADRLELFRGMNMDPGKNTLRSACEHLADRTDVVAGPHVHHGRYSFEYKSNVQCFHELYSMWGNYEKLTYDILNKGAVIGITGGGDNHEARGGFSWNSPCRAYPWAASAKSGARRRQSLTLSTVFRRLLALRSFGTGRLHIQYKGMIET